MLKKGDMSQNYKVDDGDELTVPEDTRNRILVIGAVLQPGAFPYSEPMTVMDALGLAHGPVRYVSKFSEILVIRERPGMPGNFLRIRSDIVKFVKQGDAAQNFMLEAGDVVYIPETKTPDWDRLANIVNSLFFLDRFLQGNSIFSIGR
jgi:polysaccharide export outer membrane protein